MSKQQATISVVKNPDSLYNLSKFTTITHRIPINSSLLPYSVYKDIETTRLFRFFPQKKYEDGEEYSEFLDYRDFILKLEHRLGLNTTWWYISKYKHPQITDFTSLFATGKVKIVFTNYWFSKSSDILTNPTWVVVWVECDRMLETYKDLRFIEDVTFIYKEDEISVYNLKITLYNHY